MYFRHTQCTLPCVIPDKPPQNHRCWSWLIMPKCMMNFLKRSNCQGKLGNSFAADLSLLLQFKGHGGHPKKGLVYVWGEFGCFCIPSLCSTLKNSSEQLTSLATVRLVQPCVGHFLQFVVFLTQWSKWTWKWLVVPVLEVNLKSLLQAQHLKWEALPFALCLLKRSSPVCSLQHGSWLQESFWDWWPCAKMENLVNIQELNGSNAV